MPSKPNASHGSSRSSRGRSYIIPNLERALRVLEHLSTRQEGGSITEIAKQLSLPKNSVFRILRTLATAGYLDEHDKRYRLTSKILSLGYTAVKSTHLIEACMGEMRTLRDEIDETVFVGTLSEGRVVILEELPSFHLVKFTIEIGHQVPIHASAPGKAILAFLPAAEQKSLLNHIAFTRFNDRTIPGMKAMLKEVEKIQAAGYALDLGEEVVDIWCAAAPVLDYRAYPIASIWLSGPEFRVSKMDLAKVGTVVREHALRISQQFGFDPSVARSTGPNGGEGAREEDRTETRQRRFAAGESRQPDRALR